ncbi:hypothetical protein B0H17DRAFT_1290721 [Mycena rosella]|uniref:MFS general substrate transporter n=1 Tax=Mycena rosella TaxID=1033263 RepID=A0AAD7GE18_MYCRO|nr:hypothetical protein B0H17DRAFT_1290721 [Mycena rosella]
MPVDIVNEETTLLSTPGKAQARTPLPKLQLSVIMLIQICEPLASQSIYPYINQLVSELDITGGDEKKRFGIIVFSGRGSDRPPMESGVKSDWKEAYPHSWTLRSSCFDPLFRAVAYILDVGRQPLSMWAAKRKHRLVLFASQPLSLSSVPGVMKSAVGDLTDRTNRAEGFAYLPIVWSIGTVPWKYRSPRVLAEGGDAAVLRDDGPLRKCEGPLPLRELLIFPVIISVSNYVSLGFLCTTFSALLPLFLAMPIEIGGLNLSPPRSGSFYLLTVFFFAWMIRHIGEKRVFINGIIACIPVFTLLPIMSLIARRFGLNFVIWILIGCVLALGALMDAAFGAIFMFVTASAPKSSRGTANGLSQTSVALARAIGPAMSTSLFSLSVQHNLLGGLWFTSSTLCSLASL